MTAYIAYTVCMLPLKLKPYVHETTGIKNDSVMNALTAYIECTSVDLV